MEKDDTYPLVTVVIPTYNRASLVIKAIGSVLAQTYTHLELIIVDDGSDDKTKEAVLSISDPRIRLLELPHSGHISKVRNAGAKEGKGEWIAFLDSDDIWLPQKLELQINKLKEPRLPDGQARLPDGQARLPDGQAHQRWCYGNFELMDETGNTIPPRAGTYWPYSGWIAEQVLTNEATVVICTLLVERKLFEETGGFSTDSRLAYRGDYEFALRLALKAEAVALPDLLVKVLEHPGRVTHSLKDAHERSAVPYDIFLEQNHNDKLRRIAKRRKAYLLSEAAVNRSASGDRRMAWSQLIKSMGKDTWRHWLSAVYRSFRASGSGPKQLLKTNHES